MKKLTLILLALISMIIIGCPNANYKPSNKNIPDEELNVIIYSINSMKSAYHSKTFAKNIDECTFKENLAIFKQQYIATGPYDKAKRHIVNYYYPENIETSTDNKDKTYRVFQVKIRQNKKSTNPSSWGYVDTINSIEPNGKSYIDLLNTPSIDYSNLANHDLRLIPSLDETFFDLYLNDYNLALETSSSHFYRLFDLDLNNNPVNTKYRVLISGHIKFGDTIKSEYENMIVKIKLNNKDAKWNIYEIKFDNSSDVQFLVNGIDYSKEYNDRLSYINSSPGM